MRTDVLLVWAAKKDSSCLCSDSRFVVLVSSLSWVVIDSYVKIIKDLNPDGKAALPLQLAKGYFGCDG
jgi:hypothetical protein